MSKSFLQLIQTVWKNKTLSIVYFIVMDQHPNNQLSLSLLIISNKVTKKNTINIYIYCRKKWKNGYLLGPIIKQFSRKKHYI